MRKKKSVVFLSIISAVIVLGLLASFIPINGSVKDYSVPKAIKQGIDLKGGAYAVYLADDAGTDDMSDRVSGAAEMLLAELSKSYVGVTTVREGKLKIRAEIPDATDSVDFLRAIGEPAQISFKVGGLEILNGSHVISASAVSGSAAIQIVFNSEGKARLATETATATASSPVTIEISLIVSGTASSLASVSLNEPHKSEIMWLQGGSIDSVDSAKKFAAQIMGGSFEVPLICAEAGVYIDSYAKNAVIAGIVASVCAMVFALVFLGFRYKGFGLASGLSLMGFVFLLMFLMALIPGINISLLGFAGIIISIALGVCIHVVMLESVRDEYSKGKSIIASYYSAVKKTFYTCVDILAVSLIGAIFLAIFTTGIFQSLGFILLLGTAIMIFCSMLLTRVLCNLFLGINDSGSKFYGLKRAEGVAAEDIPDSGEMTTSKEKHADKPVAAEEA